MNEAMPMCLAIGGLDPSGGAGIIADVGAISAFGCRSAAAITSVTFQNARRVMGVEHMSASSVRRQVEAVLAEDDVASVKTGMLPTSEIVRTVAELVGPQGLSGLIVDPVLKSTSGYSLIDSDAVEAMIEYLFPLARLITPNIPELEALTDVTITSHADIEIAAARLLSLGIPNVLVKGGHFPGEGGEVIDMLFEADEMYTFRHKYVPNASVRGTGCMLASAAAAGLANGGQLKEAIADAVAYVHGIIASSRGRQN
jgi:hydroxymethylpyrimidine kinase/phosphomethylpyrimidine kinase